ncbi:hypothetical protein BDV32DRAFT_4568 [Aspergillus pseudonomiae]|uniref:Uncharacterized protein n=1 Tax=Aspergillus pseudonomiae TaxID=1506151 RepID=A0A5N7DV07_9EURO|nr:uncharacterized protein BDV37DRAFT_1405 [Aspergillus pseudonomiae]KAB8263329.1 hypothetical protein BDV32DRAFT_4568 [Aspergillus pseudonomiae]KAE8409869.1 hypothetical protein BDV37DRAFT_1405 [Aspergillus pseudonomiae]
MEPATRWHVPRRLRRSSRASLGSFCKVMDVSDRHSLRMIDPTLHTILLFLFPFMNFFLFFFIQLFNPRTFFCCFFTPHLTSAVTGTPSLGNPPAGKGSDVCRSVCNRLCSKAICSRGRLAPCLPSGAIGHFRCLFLSRPHRLRNTSLNPRGQASPDPSTSRLWFVQQPGLTLSTGVMHYADHDPSVLDYFSNGQPWPRVAAGGPEMWSSISQSPNESSQRNDCMDT